jgi:hypothetical protein
MTDAPAPATAAPWTQRIAESVPWSPWRLAAALAATLLVLFLAAEVALDRLPLVFGGGHDFWAVDARVNFRITLVLILLVAYLPAAHADAVLSARRRIEELAPFLRGTSPGPLAASVGRFEPGALRRAGWIGVAVAVAIPFWIDRTPAAWVLWRYNAEPIAERILLPVMGWLGGHFFYCIVAESRRLSRIGREHVRVDLLDLRSFAPLTRQGLRQALLTVGVVSIAGLYLYDYDKRGLFAVVAISLAVVLGLAAVAMLLPLRGAHDAIAAARRAELDWCDAALRRARASLAADGAARSAAPAVADLVAWRSLVAAVREWPVDAPTLSRFVLYLAIPLGSWLGGAVVDLLVERVFG